MADVLQKASNWLQNMREKHVSQPVTYERGSQSATLFATIGKTVFAIDDGRGAVLQHESRDFLILAENLVLEGQTVLPERGDRIRETQGDITFVYEVLAPGNEPCWRYSDPYRKTIRIHAKQIRIEI
jgi:hypothetical protein